MALRNAFDAMATETTLASVLARLPALQSGAAPVAVQNWPAGWNVAVTNFPASFGAVQSGAWSVGVTGSVAVTGTFWQATQPISAASLPLPSGAATEAAQITGNASLASIDGKLPALASGRMPVDVEFPATQAVSAAALPLPDGAATETALLQVRDRLAVASAANPLDTVAATPVRQAPQKYTDISFSQVGAGLQSADLALIGPVGAGMAVNQSAGNLVITTGVTANAEVTIRSVASFIGALTLKEVTTLSQRIANNNFFVELVDVIGDGLAYAIVNATTVDVTRPAHGFTAANVGQRMDIGVITGAAGVPMEAVIASIPNADTIRFTVAGWPATGSGTCSLTGLNKIELNYTGTVATAVNFNTRRRGWQNTAIAATINTTAAAHMGIVNVENGVASLADKVVTSAGVIANRASWDTNIPRTNETMFLQIRARNGTVAPASTTTWTLGMARVEDYVPTQVSLVSTRVQSVQNSAPVSIIGTATIAGTVTANIGTGSLAAGANLIGDVGLQARAAATGAASVANVASPATPAGQVIKGSAGRAFAINLVNTSAGVCWVKLYNAASVTMGTTSAVIDRPIPAGGSFEFHSDLGLGFSTGICLAVTSARGATDNTATGLAVGDVAGFVAFA